MGEIHTYLSTLTDTTGADSGHLVSNHRASLGRSLYDAASLVSMQGAGKRPAPTWRQNKERLVNTLLTISRSLIIKTACVGAAWRQQSVPGCVRSRQVVSDLRRAAVDPGASPPPSQLICAHKAEWDGQLQERGGGNRLSMQMKWRSPGAERSLQWKVAWMQITHCSPFLSVTVLGQCSGTWVYLVCPLVSPGHSQTLCRPYWWSSVCPQVITPS